MNAKLNFSNAKLNFSSAKLNFSSAFHVSVVEKELQKWKKSHRFHRLSQILESPVNLWNPWNLYEKSSQRRSQAV